MPPIIRSFLCLALALSSCGPHKTKAKHPPLKSYCKEQQNVQLRVKPLTGAESKSQFGRNFVRRGYQPLEIVIFNNNKSYCILHPWQIGLPLTSPIKVAKKAHTNIFWVLMSMLSVGLIGVEWIEPLSALIVLAVPSGIWINHKNDEVTLNTSAQAIDKSTESVVIPPFGTINRYVFIAQKEFKQKFPITVLNSQDNTPIQFDVSLASETIIGTN